jgi:glycine dehydrogenase
MDSKIKFVFGRAVLHVREVSSRTSTSYYSSIKACPSFADRHIGLTENDQETMLKDLGYHSKDAFLDKIYRRTSARIDIKNSSELSRDGISELDMLEEFRELASMNYASQYKCMIGQGYYNTFMPTVIQKCLFDNPRWYSAYTPYQAEISQGRLEMLFHFQRLIIGLTGLPIANASLLDEASASVEAMLLAFHAQVIIAEFEKKTFLVERLIHPQIRELLQSRAKALGIKVALFSIDEDFTCRDTSDCFGAFVQYPNTCGGLPDIENLSSFINVMKNRNVTLIAGTDPLALCCFKSPGHLAFDIATGSMQRFGMPLGHGGPHAAFLAAQKCFLRKMPGRIVGKLDTPSGPVYHLSLQTREQHIRRHHATSNICTAQSLPANISTAFAIYHGVSGLVAIAVQIHRLAQKFQSRLTPILRPTLLFDTICLELEEAEKMQELLKEQGYLVRREDNSIIMSFDELTTEQDVDIISDTLLKSSIKVKRFGSGCYDYSLWSRTNLELDAIFECPKSELQMMRFLMALGEKDYSLVNGMIPLGSCTMKLNSTTSLACLNMPGFLNIHPYTRFYYRGLTGGYDRMNRTFLGSLCILTGMHDGTLQPCAGSQAELLGLLMIRRYFEGESCDKNRKFCIIPKNSHGTNAASAALAGLTVLSLDCLSSGQLNLVHLETLLASYGRQIASIMLTIPSTYGLFEEPAQYHKLYSALKLLDIQIYMDGANMNALTGFIQPGLALATEDYDRDVRKNTTSGFGVDILHLNLHKTFGIPHGGGGPGMAPIMCREHLAPYLPDCNHISSKKGAWIAGAPLGSNCLIGISYAYIKMLGLQGLQNATFCALLSANWLQKQLLPFFDSPIKTEASNESSPLVCAHEFILQAKSANSSSASWIAKRLMNFRFHAPTVSFPTPNTLMIEPTESESLSELVRFASAMNLIAVELEKQPDLLIHAPWTLSVALEYHKKHAKSLNLPFEAFILLSINPEVYYGLTTYPSNVLYTCHTSVVPKIDAALIDRSLLAYGC